MTGSGTMTRLVVPPFGGAAQSGPDAIRSLARKAVRLGSFRITFSIFDGTNFVIPTSAAWTLTDRSGNVINNRTAVPLTPAAEMNINLSGLDLDLESGYVSQARYLFVQGVMPDPQAGSLPFVNQAVFEIEDVVGITP